MERGNRKSMEWLPLHNAFDLTPSRKDAKTQRYPLKENRLYQFWWENMASCRCGYKPHIFDRWGQMRAVTNRTYHSHRIGESWKTCAALRLGVHIEIRKVA
jgi:hypothetical protein